jgi:hypothetical protein
MDFQELVRSIVEVTDPEASVLTTRTRISWQGDHPGDYLTEDELLSHIERYSALVGKVKFLHSRKHLTPSCATVRLMESLSLTAKYLPCLVSATAEGSQKMMRSNVNRPVKSRIEDVMVDSVG